MAQNKNAQIRYKALDKCFANQYKKFYINDLIEYCTSILSDHYAQETTVSRRQIFEDMDFMKSDAGFEAPIESLKDGRTVFYRYSDPEFSILKTPLNPSEMSSLQEALETLSRMNNLPGFDWVNSLQAKLQSGLNAETQKTQVISFEENEYLLGLSFLNPLYQFIINQQVIEIQYKTFTSDEVLTFTLSPYYLKQYNNRWFLFGWNHTDGYIQNLALDRMQNIISCKDQYIANPIDFEEYFEEIVGVSNDLTKAAVKIKIQLSNNIIPYIKSKPVHGSQQVKENILLLEVKLNYELQSLILSYGENMKVLEPLELVEIIKNRAKKLSANY
ncbi:helix-turn-helix transcriptional regulator [Chryseobacterium sp.]|uniref:helix-turn-helix transcriptional regulator n=1 Tax=Chryseobacterium sp. TaxID=1871047 RepID=UPI0011CBD3B5|nr:WYL domain-containing protein [Chryseobacterium sp.]TXF74981.1 WYL domain-containing protein [Chryseobacterium sp.]